MAKITVRNGSEAVERLLSKDYLLLMFAASGHAFMNQFFTTTMPLYIERLGGSKLQAGVATTVFALTALLVRPMTGILSDKVGRVKLLVIGAIICAVSCALQVSTSVILLLFVMRSLNGIGFGMHSTCAGAAIADVLPKTRMAEGIGYFGLYSTIAQAVGPGIALAIVSSNAISDYRLLFIITACLCALSALADGSVSYERKRKKLSPYPDKDAASDSEPEALQETVGGALQKTLFGFEYTVFAPVAVLILLYIGLSSLMNFIALFAKWKGYDNPGLYFTTVAIGVFISRMIFGKVADRHGSDIIIIPGLVILSVCIALIPSVGSKIALIILGFPIGLSEGAVLPTFNSMLFKRCSPARRGTASGAYFSAVDIGFAIGAPLLGALADAKDFRYIYWVAAVFSALSLLLYIFIASDKRYNSARDVPHFK